MKNRLTLLPLILMFAIVGCGGDNSSSVEAAFANDNDENHTALLKLHSKSDDTDYLHQRNFAQNGYIHLPGTELPIDNGHKVFVGWCESLPCENLIQLKYLAGEYYNLVGRKNLYALWIVPTDDWENATTELVVVSNGIEDLVFTTISNNVKTVIIPDSVTTIPGSTFKDVSQLSKVVIPNSVTAIGEDAFKGTSLTYVVIPESVTSIGAEAFAGTNITKISIGHDVDIKSDSFPNSFIDAYGISKHAGIYTYDADTEVWNIQTNK
jgi:hypothetical protein